MRAHGLLPFFLHHASHRLFRARLSARSSHQFFWLHFHMHLPPRLRNIMPGGQASRSRRKPLRRPWPRIVLRPMHRARISRYRYGCLISSNNAKDPSTRPRRLKPSFVCRISSRSPYYYQLAPYLVTPISLILPNPDIINLLYAFASVIEYPASYLAYYLESIPSSLTISCNAIVHCTCRNS